MRASQAQLAESAGFTRAQYGSWEQGKAWPSIANLARIADRLGLSIHWLVTGRGPREAAAVESGADSDADPAVVAEALALAHPSSVLSDAQRRAEKREVLASIFAQVAAVIEESGGTADLDQLMSMRDEILRRFGVDPVDAPDAQWFVDRILDPGFDSGAKPVNPTSQQWPTPPRAKKSSG